MKDLNALVGNLMNLGKEASSIENATDPAVKDAPTEVPKDRLIAPLPGQGTPMLKDVPAVSSTEPAGDQKVEGGEAGGVPSANAFVESATPASAKTATFLAGMEDLKNKLANFGKEVVAPTTETAVTPTKEAATAPTKEAAEYIPGDYLLKVAFHLMQSAKGMSAVNEALDEVLGKEASEQLIKAAADENVTFLRNYTADRLQQAEAEQAQMKAAAELKAEQDYYAELTKGASAEEIQAIDNAALLIKRASEIFEDNESATYACQAGFIAGQKIAAAMEGGMPPEEAGASAAGPAEGPPSPEELQAALASLVQQGIIQPEEAEQLLQQLLGEAGGDPAAAGDPSAAAMPPEEAAKAAAADEALAKIASVIFPA